MLWIRRPLPLGPLLVHHHPNLQVNHIPLITPNSIWFLADYLGISEWISVHKWHIAPVRNPLGLHLYNITSLSAHEVVFIQHYLQIKLSLHAMAKLDSDWTALKNFLQSMQFFPLMNMHIKAASLFFYQPWFHRAFPALSDKTVPHSQERVSNLDIIFIPWIFTVAEWYIICHLLQNCTVPW